jgi:hypothetical protein
MVDAENLIPVSEKKIEVDSFYIRYAWVFLELLVIGITAVILSMISL